jgi:hypothetical protein
MLKSFRRLSTPLPARRTNTFFFGGGGEGGIRVRARGLVVVMSTIPKRKYKRSDIEANYRNETKTF